MQNFSFISYDLACRLMEARDHLPKHSTEVFTNLFSNKCHSGFHVYADNNVFMFYNNSHKLAFVKDRSTIFLEYKNILSSNIVSNKQSAEYIPSQLLK